MPRGAAIAVVIGVSLAVAWPYRDTLDLVPYGSSVWDGWAASRPSSTGLVARWVPEALAWFGGADVRGQRLIDLGAYVGAMWAAAAVASAVSLPRWMVALAPLAMAAFPFSERAALWEWLRGWNVAVAMVGAVAMAHNRHPRIAVVAGFLAAFSHDVAIPLLVFAAGTLGRHQGRPYALALVVSLGVGAMDGLPFGSLDGATRVVTAALALSRPGGDDPIAPALGVALLLSPALWKGVRDPVVRPLWGSFAAAFLATVATAGLSPSTAVALGATWSPVLLWVAGIGLVNLSRAAGLDRSVPMAAAAVVLFGLLRQSPMVVGPDVDALAPRRVATQVITSLLASTEDLARGADAWLVVDEVESNAVGMRIVLDRLSDGVHWRLLGHRRPGAREAAVIPVSVQRRALSLDPSLTWAKQVPTQADGTVNVDDLGRPGRRVFVYWGVGNVSDGRVFSAE